MGYGQEDRRGPAEDGCEAGPAEGVAVHVRGAPSIPRWERGLEAAGPKDLAEPSSPRWVLAERWPSAGSHTHAQGREPSSQPLESGFIVLLKIIISSFQSGLLLRTAVSYGSARVVASQRTNGWTPLATT